MGIAGGNAGKNGNATTPAARKKWVPEWMRREGIDTGWIENTRGRLVRWLARRPVAEVTLLLDGPGYGCPQGLVALAMLGVERVLAMREVHAFSARTYQVLFIVPVGACLR